MKKYIGSVLIVVLTVWVFLMTTLPATRSFVNSLFLLYLAIAFLGSLYFPVARKSIRSEAVLGSYMLLIFVSVLFWVGVTGWFFSPFFYVLYLLAIMLSFIATPFSTLLFVLTLIGLFIPNIGSIDVTLDMITVFSLFSIVPITFFLQKEYLRLREQDKKVLILEEETSDMRNKVEEVLRNKIIRFAVTVRQPVNDIKQMAIVAQKDEKNKLNGALRKIARLSDDSLALIEEFEVSVTGQELLHTSSRRESVTK